MRIVLVLLLVLMPIVMTPTNTSACTFDTDCQVGSKCVKSLGQLYGVCVGGMFPGNKNDNVPVYNPLEINRTAHVWEHLLVRSRLRTAPEMRERNR